MIPSLDSLSRPASAPPPMRRVPAWLIPLAIVAGFGLLFLALFRDRLLPAQAVNVALVQATMAESVGTSPASGSGMLFQASGWIEPDPLPIKATSLVDGVVESVHVLEGQTVEKGEALATLISDDARLALATAGQNLETLQATLDAHLGAIESAKKKLEGAQAMVKSAETLREEAADRLARFEGLPRRSVPEQEVVSARLRFAREEAEILVASAFAAEAEAEIARLTLETRVRENEIQAATIDVDRARLALSRTVIHAPISGRVLRLLAAPGQKKMLQADDMESSTIAILYQPSNLQVRVDVPLADAAGLQVGQAARIRCSLLPDQVFDGVVTRITGEADVQRNTLQAKVRIIDPAEQLRPEMLSRVEFLSNQLTNDTASHAVAIWIPEAAVSDDGAWVCDPDSKRVSKREIKRTPEIREGRIRISEGLRPGEWVVLSPANLSAGQRVNPTLSAP